MRVDVVALNQQCTWRGVLPDPLSTEKSAHALLDKLPAAQGTMIQWAIGHEWQLVIAGELVHYGAFEACVLELAKRSPFQNRHFGVRTP